MTKADSKLIDEAIYKQLNEAEFEWNDDTNDNGPSEFWIFNDLLNMLTKEGLDLKVVRKNWINVPTKYHICGCPDCPSTKENQ